MKPGLDDLGDPAVDDRARVDDDVRLALEGRPLPVGRGPPEEADRLGRGHEVGPLGDGQADHAEAEEQRYAERQPLAEGPADVRERQAQQEAHERGR